MDIDTDQPTAGPSRPSPPAQSPRRPLDTDVEMDEQEAMSLSLQALAAADEMALVSGSQSQEAAELLLGFSSIEPRHDDIPTLDPPSPSIPHTGIEPPRLLDHANSENSYPYTPPDLPRTNGDTPSISNPNPYASSLAHLHPTLPSSPAQATSPEAGPSKPKQAKRKRTAANSSSRRTSTDPARPPHFMGEDNEIIRCICGIDEDDGLTIQCESCYAWQHGQCFGYSDAESAPEIYYCELCAPRPYDPGRAREIQVDARDRRRERERGEAENLAMGLPTGGQHVAPIPLGPGPSVGFEKPKSRAKGKRARVGSVLEGDDRGEKDPSPGTMAPPTARPRKKPGPKPKVKPAISTPLEPTPTPTYYPPVAAPTSFFDAEAEDDYFRIEPWAMEYTPVRDNIVRGRETRRIMGKMYREWVDAEEDEEVLSTANKRRAVAGPSGLPSPTETGLLRFTPDNLFPSPDFSTLAPPVPPATLLGPDLQSLGHPTSVQSIPSSLSFLPLSYSDAIPLAGPFIGPALYGVFAVDHISSSSFIGEYRAEVIDCESYRRDPVNQYDVLGMTKPHVQPIGPPVNLMLDARGYGCDLRFIRSGCHPNVVLRPLLFRASEMEAPKLRFGIFASCDIAKNAELVLGWAWDDSHVVHALRSAIHPTTLVDGYPGRPNFASSLSSDSPVIHSLLDKFETVLTHLLGTFSSCACSTFGNCAIGQMRHLVERRDETQSKAGRRGDRADLGELVGAVRGWRRRAEELEVVRKWNLPREIAERVWSKEDEQVEEAEEEEADVLGPREDEVRLEQNDAESEDRSASGGHSDVEDEEGMDVDEDEQDTEDDQPRRRRASPLSSLTPPPSRGSQRSASTPRPRSHSPRPIGIAPSSVLSSAPRTLPRPQPQTAADDGHLSDATTATIPRSSSSDGGDDESDDEAAPSKPNGTGARKRRVLSPVAEQKPPSPKIEPGHKVRRIRKDGKEDKRFKARDATVPAVAVTAGSNKRGRNRIVSSPGSDDEVMDLPGRRREKEEMASALFPEDKEDVKMENGDVEMEKPVEEEEVRVERIPTPPPPPAPVVKLPTPPPREPPKKVSISDYLKNRKIQKKSTTDVGSGSTLMPNGDAADSNLSTLPESTNSASATSDVKSDLPEFNMFDFLPSSRPNQAPPPSEPISVYGTSQTFESPRPTPLPTPGTSYIPRSEYFPNTSSVPAPTSNVSVPVGTSSFQPRSQSGYIPRGSVSTESESAPVLSFTPRRQSTPVEEQPPRPPPVDELPIGRENGYPRSGSALMAPSRSASSPSAVIDLHFPPGMPIVRSRQRSTSESPVKRSIPLPEQTTAMPPPLHYREPPPHQLHFRQYNSASLSPEARTSGLPPYRSPIDHTSPLPRLPPTGPKAAQTPGQSVIIPPTGPRGSWQTPTSATVSTPTSAGSAGAPSQSAGTPVAPIVAPIPPLGPRGPMGPIPVPGLNGRGGGGGFGGNMRFFEARGGWRGRGGMGRGHHVSHGARGR